MSTLKAEFQYQYYKSHSIPFRTRFFAGIDRYNRLGALFPGLSNFFLHNKITGSLIKNVLGVAQQRSLPRFSPQGLRSWWRQSGQSLPIRQPKGRKVYLFCDEFTNFNEAGIGIQAIRLLLHLGYEVQLIDHPESGRAAISKGLLDQARRAAETNVQVFSRLIDEQHPLLGIEPSAILSFRDEYPRLLRGRLQHDARELSRNCLLIDEFLAREVAAGEIKAEQFTTTVKHVLLHGHCHQKALGSVEQTAMLLSLPVNYSVEVIPSGCCGMAGSFGYEKEHFGLSMQIGELELFPAVRRSASDHIIVAPGTSCRHQIADGTGRQALHPVELLWQAILPDDEQEVIDSSCDAT